MERKIIFLDIDGTTVTDDKRLPEENHKAIHEAIAAGHYVVISSGRATSAVYSVVENIGLVDKGCYLMSYNGAVLYDCYEKKVVKERTVALEDVKYLHAEVEAAGLYCQTYDDYYLVADKYTKETEFYVSQNGTPTKIIPDLWETIDWNPNKLLICNIEDHDKLVRFQQEHMEWEKGRCYSIFTCPQYLEYAPYGTSKGVGLQMLSEHLGVAIENTIAVGDEMNDLPMIQAAGLGVAMKNANPKILPYADYVTEKDNNHAGVAEVIRKFMLN